MRQKEAVNHVLRTDLGDHVRVFGDVELIGECDVVVGGKNAVRARIAHSPFELFGDDLDTNGGRLVRDSNLCIGPGVPLVDRQPDENEAGDDRPDRLRHVAVADVRSLDSGLAPVPNDEPEQRALGEEKEDGDEDEDHAIEMIDALTERRNVLR
jgi:hypothetical protein